MSNPEYCSVEDVYEQAAPYGSLEAPTREVSSVDTANDTLEISGHGCRLNDAIRFRPISGGDLPAPLSAATIYYAKPVAGSSALLQVAPAPDGDAIDLTSAGESFGLAFDSSTAIRAHIRKWSTRITPYIPAKAKPLEPDEDGRYPDTVRDLVAVLAAWSRLGQLGRTSKALDALVGEEKEFMKLTLAGLPPRDPGFTTSNSNLAVGRSPTYGNRRDVIP